MDTATTEIYTYCHTLSLHDALPILPNVRPNAKKRPSNAHPSGRSRATSGGVIAHPNAAPIGHRGTATTIRATMTAAEIGRAHVSTPVTNAHLVCRLLLETKYSHKH